jgi:hypothetical protein
MTTASDYEDMKSIFTKVGLQFSNANDYEYVTHEGNPANQVIHLVEGGAQPEFYCAFYFLDGKFVGHQIRE